MTPAAAHEARAALAARIDDRLPQTQCRRCGYPSCRAYADALAAREAPPNRCPPGGQRLAEVLAALLARPALALDPGCGVEGPWTVARIVEADCIGCTLCIQACPVDAILGAARRMHTVIESECTGCELCLAPCPVDCIVLSPMPAPRRGTAFLDGWMATRAAGARTRFRQREARLARRALERSSTSRRRRTPSRDERRADIAAAVQRSRERRARLRGPGGAPS